MGSEPDDPRQSSRYQLVGVLEGETTSFTLWEGQLTVGALEDNDIWLPVPAVSRHHAVFDVRGSRVIVKDTKSKNGSWLNGVRIIESAVKPGDTIAFGPAVFTVFEVEVDDDKLAIVSERRKGVSVAGGQDDEDTNTAGRRASDHPPAWIDILERFAESILSMPEPDPNRGLEALVDGLGALSGVIAEVPERAEPVVIAAVGQPSFHLDHPEVSVQIKAVRAKALSGGEMLSAFLVDDPEPLTCAVATPGEAPSLLLGLGGSFHRRIGAQELMKLALRMILARRVVAGTVTSPSTEREKLPDIIIPKDYVVGRSAAMRNVYKQIRTLQRGDIPVLITGETGSGKECIAQILHASSQRHEGPFVAINCAAIPSELLEAELFGIERGVATGVDARKGKFQLADGGTLLLDEIADMSAVLQAKLLRALEEMEVNPLGAKVPVPVNVRVISATNTDLKKRIAERKFRRDLYFRLAGFPLRIPPLRERRDDIPLLVEHFMRRYAAEIGKPVRGVTVKALQLLAEAPWPGNVRELEHEVRRLVYLCPPNQAIDSSMLSETVVSPTININVDALDLSSDLSMDHHTAELERKLITLALRRTRGNRSKAAKLLGISRNGLALKIERLGIK